jgi:aspartate aminotransferase
LIGVSTVLLSENVRELEASATLAVALLAKELRAKGRDIIDLSAGEPDLATPDFIREAGTAAIERGETHYTPVAGVPALRNAIARHLSDRAGRAIDPAGVVVSCGAKHALFNVCFSLFGPGDRVLVPVPYWTSYPEILKLARAEWVPVHASEDRAFKPTVSELAAHGPRINGLLLTSPSNPTGAVYEKQELEAILAWAAEHEVWVLSDEIYGSMCWTAGQARAPSVLDFDETLLERVVLIDGASKAFAMTGWRIGFSYSDPRLASAISALQSHTTSNPSTPAQYAALAAYEAEPPRDEAIREILAAFARRRELVLALAQEHLADLSWVRPDGAFYLFIRTDSVYGDRFSGSVELCRWLIEEAGVALVPGSAFGDDRYVRLSFAAADAQLEEGIRRIGTALEALGTGPVAAPEHRRAEAQP